MIILLVITIATILTRVNILAEKYDLDSLNNTKEFLNFGDKEVNKIIKDNLNNKISKSKIDVLGAVFKKEIDAIKLAHQTDFVFLIDGSSSVGEINFQSELKFVKKILSDVTVDYNHSRVAIITFSSSSNIVKNVDEISNLSTEQNKCQLLNKELNNITYKGGDTFTLGAFQAAKEIFNASNRNNATKVLFLITDGYSNGGDPRQVAEDLKNDQVTIFTIGIRNGNYKELHEVSSSPGEFHSYLLDSYNEFESLARRALHVDLKSGDYIPLGFSEPCNALCDKGDCCDENALCSCGTSTGHYLCVCRPGFYGTGLKGSCFPCPLGMYSDGPNLCLPCPDPQHITESPASGIESCRCKEGYTATKNHSCKELKCPILNTPEHGYFVNKRECVTIINSACGIRCEVGYLLNGTSIRLCQTNATWSGIDPICQVKTCTSLPTPEGGQMKCFHPDLGLNYDGSEKMLPVDSVCAFSCKNGTKLTGSKLRTCLPLAKWDGLRTMCKPIKCNKLPGIKHGKFDPPSCQFGKQEFGKKCKIVCDEGFEINGPDEKICGGPRGMWSSKFEESTCVDVISPKIFCPENVTITTLPGRRYGTTEWTKPNISDNSALNVTIWSKPAVQDINEFKFEIGTNNITYFAQDAFENIAQCTFHVTVKDEEPPIIENCENPPPFLTSDSTGANITWDEPNIFDNSQQVKVNKSHDFGFFKVGTTTVTYTAIDPSGNFQECQINITVEVSQCQTLSDISYGNSECIDKEDGIQCIITCEEGYAIPISQLNDEDNGMTFFCKHVDPIWSNDVLSDPECTITKIPEESIQNGEVIVDSPNICNNSQKIDEIENDIKLFINNNVCNESCITDWKTQCNPEDEEEKTNEIMRFRRNDFEQIPHRNRNKKRKKLNLKFQVRGKYINGTDNGFERNIVSSGYNASIRLDKKIFVCPPGFIPRKNRCVQCPRGTYHNQTRNKCSSCSFGSYNEKLGQIQCSMCPENHSTRKMHSKRSGDCKPKCPPGTYARKKLIKYSKQQPNRTVEITTLFPYCRSCGYGFYQPEYGETSCQACPKGYTTYSARAQNIEECIPTAEEMCRKTDVCLHGSCVPSSSYHYSCNCFKNYVGSHCEKLTNKCDSNPCFNGGKCILTNQGFMCSCKTGFSGTFCEELLEIKKCNCLNNGTCVGTDNNGMACICEQGFGDDSCEIKLSYCKESLCENNGTCEESDSTFKCNCKNGYIGKRCHLLPCDYKPCKAEEICENVMTNEATRNSYRCLCTDGSSGKCNEPINYCQNVSCLNDGICISEQNRFSCKCSDKYYGSTCELKRTSKYLLNFTSYDTNNYIRMPGFTQSLTEITACLWMQTQDNFNYGTLISYATKDKDNTFTLTDYTGLVLYINNNHIVTDIVLNDGFWHHVCVVWRSSNGSYEFFVDGKLSQNGTSFCRGHTIEGYGNLIIGQEQDVLGGKFSHSESFIGKMAYIDIWSRPLTYSEILRHFSDCNESFFGDLYEWSAMQEYVKGNVQIVNSTFCLKCEEPEPLYNGFIDVIDNVAHYSCYKGYVLNHVKFAKGRKCTKASKWDGTYEPFCKRVYCGYPGNIKNGYQIGNKYYYEDKIMFRCHESYDLVGNRTIQCMENGKWYPEKPKCIGLQCYAFKQPAYSALNILSDSSYEDYKENVTTFEPGTQIEIHCDEKANLTGEDILTCTENGTWNFVPPLCVIKEDVEASRLKCDIKKVPQPPSNGYIDVSSLLNAENGTTNFIEYKCRPGFRLSGDNTSTCIIDGYWTEPNITCIMITCPKPSLPKNMIYDPERNPNDLYRLGNLESFFCKEGYYMIGKNKIRCLLNGRWSRMLGKCIKKSCKKPKASSQTIITGKSYLFGDIVNISCPSGKKYELKCNKDGIWEGKRDDSC